jgi:predicted dinucleotide-binding enzyme
MRWFSATRAARRSSSGSRESPAATRWLACRRRPPGARTRFPDVLQQAGDISGKVIVSCSLPMNADNTELVVAHTSSGLEELAKIVPKARVAAAFNSVPSEVLFSVYEGRRRAKRPSLVYCGDDKRAKSVAATLIRDVGFNPVDAGPARIARYIEPFALLVAQLAYEGKGGPEPAYRFDRRGK